MVKKSNKIKIDDLEWGVLFLLVGFLGNVAANFLWTFASNCIGIVMGFVFTIAFFICTYFLVKLMIKGGK